MVSSRDMGNLHMFCRKRNNSGEDSPVVSFPIGRLRKVFLFFFFNEGWSFFGGGRGLKHLAGVV